MPLSSVLGASTLIKPGVVTSSTRPAVPYEGQLIYETDTDRIAAYSGSAWVTQNGLQLIKAQAVGSGVSSVTVTGAFNSTYDSYDIIWTGGVASGSSNGRLTLGSVATGYYAGWLDINYVSGATVALTDNNQAYWSFGSVGQTGIIQMKVHLDGPNLAKITTAIFTNPNPTAGGGSLYGSGYNTSTLQHTDFTLTAASGTWTGGTIRVYGYANN